MRTPWIAALRSSSHRAQIKTKSLVKKTVNRVQRSTQQIVSSRPVRVGTTRLFAYSNDLIDWARRQVATVIRVPRLVTDRRLLEPFTGLVLIAAFVVIGNQANHQALAAPAVWETDVAGLAAEEISQVLMAVDPLTPELTEDPERIASLLVPTDEAYLTRPDAAQMAEAETLSKRDPIPYVVQQGDTLVTIARANERTVATILDANGIKPEDAGKIKPGTTLLIPQEDTSDSLAWLEADQRAKAEAARLAAERQAKAAAAAAAARSRTLASSSSKQVSNEGFAGDAGGGFITPINHNGISRGLGRGHTGIDYRANTGTPVAAAAAGRVVEITRGWAGGWGTSIVVDHGRGRTSRYAHLSDVAIGIGSTVNQGQTIGYSGNTGRSTGPHLHFEVRVGGRAVSPF